MLKLDLKLESFEWFQRKWRTTEVLVVLLVVTVALSIGAAAVLQLSPIGIAVLVFTSLFGVVGLWGWCRQIPKTKAGKVGFVVAINCDDHLRNSVRDDFVLSLRTHIRNGPSSDEFDFIELPHFFANKIVDTKDAEAIRLKMRANFFLAGRVRRRSINGKEKDVLNIIGIVAHARTTKENEKLFSTEFGELLPQQLILDPENSLPQLAFTAAWAGAVAKYVIGIAAAISKDFSHAKNMFTAVRQMLARTDDGFLVYDKLKARIAMHLGAIAQAEAIRNMNLWRDTRDMSYVEEVSILLEEAKAEGISSVALSTLNATYQFVSSRSTRNAMLFLQQIPKSQRDGLWHLNAAFLKAYDGKLKEASQGYRAAEKTPLPHDAYDVIAQVEDFISWVYDSEPDKVQFLFCLGMLNDRLKGDGERAIADFKLFLERCPDGAFPTECAHARDRIANLAKAS
jgi:hypothetical protein